MDSAPHPKPPDSEKPRISLKDLVGAFSDPAPSSAKMTGSLRPIRPTWDPTAQAFRKSSEENAMKSLPIRPLRATRTGKSARCSKPGRGTPIHGPFISTIPWVAVRLPVWRSLPSPVRKGRPASLSNASIPPPLPIPILTGSILARRKRRATIFSASKKHWGSASGLFAGSLPLSGIRKGVEFGDDFLVRSGRTIQS